MFFSKTEQEIPAVIDSIFLNLANELIFAEFILDKKFLPPKNLLRDMLCKTLVNYGYKVGFDKFFTSLDQIPPENRFVLKKTIPWHGLAVDEPLDFETVLKNTYLNPDRKKFPSMWSGVDKLDLVLRKTSTQHFLTMIGKDNFEKFNQHSFKLHNTSVLLPKSCRDNTEVNKTVYLIAVKSSRWYGPYTRFDEVGRDENNRPILKAKYAFLSIPDSSYKSYHVLISFMVERDISCFIHLQLVNENRDIVSQFSRINF